MTQRRTYTADDERRLREEFLSDHACEPWQAEITRTALPFIWNVSISKGLMGFREWPPPTIGTRKRAEAVTRRRIRRLERAAQRDADRTTITGGTT